MERARPRPREVACGGNAHRQYRLVLDGGRIRHVRAIQRWDDKRLTSRERERDAPPPNPNALLNVCVVVADRTYPRKKRFPRIAQKRTASAARSWGHACVRSCSVQFSSFLRLPTTVFAFTYDRPGCRWAFSEPSAIDPFPFDALQLSPGVSAKEAR